MPVHALGLGPAGQRHLADALHGEPHVVIEVEGLGQDHFVAGAGNRRGGHAEGVVAAGGDGHLAKRDGSSVLV